MHVTLQDVFNAAGAVGLLLHSPRLLAVARAVAAGIAAYQGKGR